MVLRTRSCHYTRIYTVIEYVPNAAIKDFTVQVAEARLHGDRDPRYALTAEMRKLEGNASYGTLITNKEKHRDIIYVDEVEIGRQIISPHFYDMTELPDGYYEVPCIMCVQYRGGCSVPWGVFSTVGDIMSTVGDILSTVGGVQYRGGIS